MCTFGKDSMRLDGCPKCNDCGKEIDTQTDEFAFCFPENTWSCKDCYYKDEYSSGNKNITIREAFGFKIKDNEE